MFHKKTLTLKEAISVAEQEIERHQKNKNIPKGNIRCVEAALQSIEVKDDVFKPWRYLLVFRIKKRIYYEVIVGLKGNVLSLKRKRQFKKLI